MMAIANKPAKEKINGIRQIRFDHVPIYLNIFIFIRRGKFRLNICEVRNNKTDHSFRHDSLKYGTHDDLI
jgi:hypothetical protein